MDLTTTYQLSNGVKIPVVGFGTWQTPSGQIAKEAVLNALKAGYRHIDTAAAYKNETSVGQAITESGLARKDLFITTKLWNEIGTYEDAKTAINQSLEKLGLEYLDLYLIHWPNPLAFREHWEKRNAQVWQAMEEAVEAGKIRAIGVSNFHPHHLEALFKTAKIKPVINQILLNPSDQQEKLVAYNQAHNIVSEAYSPLGTGKIFEVSELQALAQKYKKTVAQLVLRWSLQKNFLPLPKSVTKERIIENLAIFDFAISVEDMQKIDQLQGQVGSAKNPDEVPF